MHRAILRKRPMDAYIGNYTHTGHCEEVLTHDVLELGLEIVDVAIQRKFVACGLDGHSMELYHPLHSFGQDA